FQEGHGLPELRVAAHLDAEGHAARVLAEPEPPAQLLREQADAVVLGPAAQEDAARALIRRVLALREPEPLDVERLGAVHVVDEEADRTDLGDLERPREEHALD